MPSYPATAFALPALLLACVARPGRADERGTAAARNQTTYSIEYRVRISNRTPATANVRWELAGIDEIRRLRLSLQGDRFYAFSGTGTLEQRGDELLWRPGSPYAHLQYKVRLRSRRHPAKGFDSYATSKWIVTRAQALFPATHVTFETEIESEPRSRSRVVFLLPQGWQSYTAMEELAPGVFRPERRGKRLDRPSGWIALGELQAAQRVIEGSRVQIVKAPGSAFDAEGALDLFSKAVPPLSRILRANSPKVLIVSATDPMWRGGLSGENSFYLHGDRPLRTPDRTSPPLHELFHVLATFRPGADAHWISEGLAEFYSLELQRRVGVLDEPNFQRGLRLFKEYGLWHVDLTAEHGGGATNNSAPLVMYAIDRSIRRLTEGSKSIDDVVREVSGRTQKLSTAAFLHAVNTVSGRNFTSFFQRHVYAGEPPGLPEAPPGLADRSAAPGRGRLEAATSPGAP